MLCVHCVHCVCTGLHELRVGLEARSTPSSIPLQLSCVALFRKVVRGARPCHDATLNEAAHVGTARPRLVRKEGPLQLPVQAQSAVVARARRHPICRPRTAPTALQPAGSVYGEHGGHRALQRFRNFAFTGLCWIASGRFSCPHPSSSTRRSPTAARRVVKVGVEKVAKVAKEDWAIG